MEMSYSDCFIVCFTEYVDHVHVKGHLCLLYFDINLISMQYNILYLYNRSLSLVGVGRNGYMRDYNGGVPGGSGSRRLVHPSDCT